MHDAGELIEEEATVALARVHSRAGLGIEAPEVTVEVHLGGGLPSMSIVGLPETAVRESKDRVRAALQCGGFEFPARRITVSLAPADLPKDGARFDLPIALGILAASRQVGDGPLDETEFCGELGLDGHLRPVAGALPMAIRARDCERTLVLPAGNADEAALVDGARLRSARSLLEVAAWLNGRGDLPVVEARPPDRGAPVPDLADVVGQAHARRALEIAAAGGHNLLMSGPPGTGKTMLAVRLPGILPEMTPEEALETACIVSVAQGGAARSSWFRRPFRAPHHTCSHVALVGGGRRPRPGEISLAHNGVLFLDELPEFKPHVLETLREPMESGRIVISRAARRAEYPARFQLVAAMNPCPCGYHGDASARCHCSAEQVRRYRGRISGPLLDRIDLRIHVGHPDVPLLGRNVPRGEASQAVRARVTAAHAAQMARAGLRNADLGPGELERDCGLAEADLAFVQSVAARLGYSPRAQHRVLKVARTIADLAEARRVQRPHLAEALALRRLDAGPPCPARAPAARARG